MTAEHEPTRERRTKPMPELEFEDSLTRAALRGRRFEDFPANYLGGRFAAIPTTIQVPDEEYFGEEILKKSRGLSD
jgi:hypothetical protein